MKRQAFSPDVPEEQTTYYYRVVAISLMERLGLTEVTILKSDWDKSVVIRHAKGWIGNHLIVEENPERVTIKLGPDPDEHN